MSPWECKTAVSPHLCSLPPPCTITTTVLGAPDCRHETTEPREEGGLLSTVTRGSGCRLTWEPSHVWRESVLRVGTIPISLWSPIQCLTVGRVASLWLTEKEGGQGYVEETTLHILKPLSNVTASHRKLKSYVVFRHRFTKSYVDFWHHGPTGFTRSWKRHGKSWNLKFVFQAWKSHGN